MNKNWFGQKDAQSTPDFIETRHELSFCSKQIESLAYEVASQLDAGKVAELIVIAARIEAQCKQVDRMIDMLAVRH